MKRAMIQVDEMLDNRFKGQADLILQIHDSLIIECDRQVKEAVATELVKIMESVAPELPVKLKADVSIGENWGEL